MEYLKKTYVTSFETYVNDCLKNETTPVLKAFEEYAPVTPAIRKSRPTWRNFLHSTTCHRSRELQLELYVMKILIRGLNNEIQVTTFNKAVIQWNRRLPSDSKTHRHWNDNPSVKRCLQEVSVYRNVWQIHLMKYLGIAIAQLLCICIFSLFVVSPLD